MQTRIVVEVTPEGQVKLDAECFQGSRCLQATDELVARLAQLGLCLDAQQRSDKPEMALEAQATSQRQQVKQ